MLRQRRREQRRAVTHIGRLRENVPEGIRQRGLRAKKDAPSLCTGTEDDTLSEFAPAANAPAAYGSNMKKGGFRERHMPPEKKLAN